MEQDINCCKLLVNKVFCLRKANTTENECNKKKKAQ